jgi:hypothetical protein
MSVCGDRGRRHLQASFCSADKVEERESESRCISESGGGRSTGERGQEPVDGALGDGVGLPQQFFEQVVCVIRAERPGADAHRGCVRGGAGRPAA